MMSMDERKVIRERLKLLENIAGRAREALSKKNYEILTPEERDLFLYITQTAGVQNSDVSDQVDFVEQVFLKNQEEYQDKLIEQARTDITAFPEAINNEWFPAKHHLLMLKHLERVYTGESRRLIISLPVGHAKTVYASKVFPTYVLGKNPHERILCAGHTQRFAEKEIGDEVRQILNRESYNKIFPHVSIRSETVDKVILNPTRVATPGSYSVKGVKSGISGYRASLIVADDLYPTNEDAQNPGYREGVFNWFWNDLMTRRLPYTRVVLVCTRWHLNDIIGELLAAQKNSDDDEKWETVLLPALCDDPDNDPLGRNLGDALWPEAYSKEMLLKIKAETTPKAWRCLYQGRPIQEEGSIVKSSWFMRWDNLPEDKMIRRRFVAFDTADKTSARADFSAGTAWIQTYDNRFFLVDIMNEKLEYISLVKAINDFTRKNKASTILIEDTAIGRTILTAQKGLMAAPMIPIKHDNKSKVFHFEEISPMFESGQVFLPRIHPLLDDLECQLIEFPESKHDDLVDSVTIGLRWAKGSTTKRGFHSLIGVN